MNIKLRNPLEAAILAAAAVSLFGVLPNYSIDALQGIFPGVSIKLYFLVGVGIAYVIYKKYIKEDNL